MPGIDYSKWDKVDYGDSSDESDCLDHPRVTRLDGPARVTRDADGMITIDRSSAGPLAVASRPPTTEAGFITTAPTATNISDAPSNADAAAPQVVPLASQSALNDKLTTNGGRFVDEQTKSHIFWSQDRQEVIVSIEFVADKIRSRNIHVEATGLISYGERNAAVAGSDDDGQLKVTAKMDSGETVNLLEGDLTHKVHLAEDEDDIEWEILSEGDRKFVCITLRKAVPMAGVVVWWDQILKHCPKIDLSSIRGRAKDSASVENAWEEAHRMFKEKVTKGQPFSTD